MSNLEEKGLLYSPHTSSGRVPTDKGLKFFVDGMLEIGDLTSEERKSIQAKCSVAGKTLMEVLDHSSKEFQVYQVVHLWYLLQAILTFL